jgi:hypothetical protein
MRTMVLINRGTRRYWKLIAKEAKVLWTLGTAVGAMPGVTPCRSRQGAIIAFTKREFSIDNIIQKHRR